MLTLQHSIIIPAQMDVLFSKQAIEHKCLSASENKITYHVASMPDFYINIIDVFFNPWIHMRYPWKSDS